MRAISWMMTLFVFVSTVCNRDASAAEITPLDTYTCAQLIADLSDPEDGAKLLRSLMMISWATGYTSAHQNGVPRADTPAMGAIATKLSIMCSKVPTQTTVRVISEAIRELAGAEPANITLQPTVSTPSPSRWDQGGSVLALRADGASRKFIYETPTAELETVGIRKGSMLFDGKKIGEEYIGTAYAFAQTCKPIAYQVRGQISPDQKQVTLRGKAANISAGCKVTGFRDEALEFRFIEPH